MHSQNGLLTPFLQPYVLLNKQNNYLSPGGTWSGWPSLSPPWGPQSLRQVSKALTETVQAMAPQEALLRQEEWAAWAVMATEPLRGRTSVVSRLPRGQR